MSYKMIDSIYGSVFDSKIYYYQTKNTFENISSKDNKLVNHKYYYILITIVIVSSIVIRTILRAKKNIFINH